MEKTTPRWRTVAKGAIIFIIIVCACAFGWIAIISTSKYDEAESVRLNIPANATEQAVADSLKSRLGESFGSNALMLWHMQDGSAARAHGSYVVKPGTSAFKVSRMLKAGLQTPVKVTYNNVRTIGDAAERICRNLEITPTQLLEAFDSLMRQRGISAEKHTAMLVPDTYEFYWSASAPAVARRMVEARDRYWNDERTAAAAALGLTPEQASTLASIVEEETAKADEMPKVARLYLNRLGKGMLLQADPTVKFAVGDFSLKRILSVHLKKESPYNTYIYPGLPPGPIRVASKRGIEAVLHPASHPYIYMCAKEDFSGYHNFASTFAEHQANASRYRRALDARGIK